MPNENKSTKRPESGLSTRAMHTGARRDATVHSLTPPIVQTSAYSFENTEAVIDYMEARKGWDEPLREQYGRYSNPTAGAVEKRLAALEGGDDAILVSSGMAAITTSLLILLSNGDHLVMTDDCYNRTRRFVNTFLNRYDVKVSIVPAADLTRLEAAVRPNTRLILSESPTNPFLRCLDLEALADIGQRHGVRTLIDSTFATPLNLRPLDYGIDIVVHSVTKYLAGHNDLLAGVIIGSREISAALRESQGTLGAVVDPSVAFNINRGLQTLGLRVERQNANGLAVAQHLERHPKIRRVWYPGLPSHPDHAVARRQMSGFGGVVSFEIEGDGPAAARFIDALQFVHLAPSLGGVDSLIIQPALISYYDTPPEERLALGIRDELVRFALGIEDAADLIADLEQALARV